MKPVRMSAAVRGQAVVEALFALTMLSLLFVLVPMLGRLQDMGLQASFAARHLSFSLSRETPAIAALHEDVVQRFFEPEGYRFQAHGGGSMLLPARRPVSVDVWTQGNNSMPTGGQIGGNSAEATRLRQELLFPDRGLVFGRVVAAPGLRLSRSALAQGGPSMLGLNEWTSMRPVLHRYLAMLTDAGHAADDLSVQARIGASDHAWRLTANETVRAGRALTSGLRLLDEPWGRALPNFDWLQPWNGLVPEDRVDALERSVR